MNNSIHSVGSVRTSGWLWWSLLVVLLDQLTKYWASNQLQLHQPVPVIADFLNWTLMHNAGAAFSFLAHAGGWQRGFFITLSFAITLVLLVWLSRTPPTKKGLCFGLSGIIGGAMGNVIDRIVYGHVIDFIDIYYQSWHWPAFNLADSAITFGVVFLLIDSLGKQEPSD